MNTLAPSSLFAYGNPNIGYDFSSDSGNFPKEVLAVLESRAIANAFRPNNLVIDDRAIYNYNLPAKVKGFYFFSCY
jgi:hypothetical protein